MQVRARGGLCWHLASYADAVALNERIALFYKHLVQPAEAQGDIAALHLYHAAPQGVTSPALGENTAPPNLLTTSMPLCVRQSPMVSL